MMLMAFFVLLVVSLSCRRLTSYCRKEACNLCVGWLFVRLVVIPFPDWGFLEPVRLSCCIVGPSFHTWGFLEPVGLSCLVVGMFRVALCSWVVMCA